MLRILCSLGPIVLDDVEPVLLLDHVPTEVSGTLSFAHAFITSTCVPLYMCLYLMYSAPSALYYIVCTLCTVTYTRFLLSQSFLSSSHQAL